MALLVRYRCNVCDVALGEPQGTGFYVQRPGGPRQVMGTDPSPTRVETETGLQYMEAWLRGMVGEIHACICLACARQFPLDVERDVKRCPGCGGLEVRTLRGSVGGPCPACRRGRIESEALGVS